ncbi:MAG: type II toxin-antitoxin system VapC family toxin [Gemmatimonadetes bacterium]|jgi:predicted nucleic acid-binding protein|nr:type II toxin-antitoxin system VapC family toxin [Gemmatimonadota bacterium]
MYVDTCMVAKLYFPEPESDAVQEAVSAADGLACSEILITEFAAVASRKRAENDITADQQARVLREFSKHVDEGYWSLLPCTRDELVAAADLIRRCQGKARVRTMDAVHLSTCLTHRQFPLFTTDRTMLRAAQHVEIPTRTV